MSFFLDLLRLMTFTEWYYIRKRYPNSDTTLLESSALTLGLGGWALILSVSVFVMLLGSLEFKVALYAIQLNKKFNLNDYLIAIIPLSQGGVVNGFRERLVKLGYTPREIDVIEVVGWGVSNREAAEHLFVSEKTVKYHLTNIYKKTKIKSREQLVVKCQRDWQFSRYFQKKSDSLITQLPSGLVRQASKSP